MTSPKISLICEPRDLLMFREPLDERFIEAIGRHAGVEIQRLDGRLQDVAPDDGWLLLDTRDPHASLVGCPMERRVALTSRLILLDVKPRRIFDRLLEYLSVAAAVDQSSLQAWQAHHGATGSAQGLYGLREVALALGAACDVEASERYCRMWSDDEGGLPQLLAKYLESLHTSRTAH